MKVIAVDDEQIALDNLEIVLKEFPEVTQITTFRTPDRALEWLERNQADAAFLDINMQKMDGLTLAKRLKELCPCCAVIFVTGYSEYAVKAFEIHADGYLMKPVRAERIRKELDYIRNLPADSGSQKTHIRIQCFGNFEVFSDGTPVKFERSRTKELLAYLVDRRGASANTGELCAVLWENMPDTLSRRSQLRTLISDLTHTLERAGGGNILIKRRNSFAIDIDRVDCDYYAFLRQDARAVNLYSGEYMSQYSWAEMTLGFLKK